MRRLTIIAGVLGACVLGACKNTKGDEATKLRDDVVMVCDACNGKADPSLATCMPDVERRVRTDDMKKALEALKGGSTDPLRELAKQANVSRCALLEPTQPKA